MVSYAVYACQLCGFPAFEKQKCSAYFQLYFHAMLRRTLSLKQYVGMAPVLIVDTECLFCHLARLVLECF